MLLSGYSQLNREMNSIVEGQQQQKIDLLRLLKSWISQGLVASKWCLERSRASHFSQQIGLRNKKLHAYILVVFGYLDLKFCMLVPDVIAFTVLKKFGNPKQSLKPPGIPYHIYNMGGGCLGACWSFDFSDAWREDLHVPESIVFTLHCYSWSVLYPLSSPNIYCNLCFV